MEIKDLSKELDTAAASAVHGGANSNAANNVIGQVQTLNVPVAISGEGPVNNNITVTGTQNASIFNAQEAGDLMALLPLFPCGPVRL
ncbi:MAG: hypothetical protein HS128_04625 [Ideonella sp.]|nr:hypothetical protein [Ideonella sp.]MCC7455481.1 hypothetical protein [Nitrospira sp.]